MSRFADAQINEEWLNRKIVDLGFSHFGWTTIQRPQSFEFYKEWLNKGYAGDMVYLHEHAELKEHPHALLPQAQSALVLAHHYVPHPSPNDALPALNKGLYARGNDYHFWLKEKLQSLIKEIQTVEPRFVGLAFTDSGPVLERDLAYRAGLGWVGKNTCLISEKHGSLFFIGEILTNIKVTDEVSLAPDRCGTCTRCMESCPTEAIVAPREIDARKCISYLTIESKQVPSQDIRSKIGDWYFGCDICQTVCPWNHKVFQKKWMIPEPSREALIHDLRVILTSGTRAIERLFKGTPLNRIQSWRHKRNAITIVANKKLYELKGELSELLLDRRLTEHVRWALAELTQNEPNI